MARIIHSTVLCLSNNKIYATYPGFPFESAVLVQNVNNYDAIPIPGGGILRKSAIVYSTSSTVPNLYRICFTIKTIPFVKPIHPVYASVPGTPPELTAYNNARRLVNLNGVRHLVFTCGNGIYHTFLVDTVWTEPVLVGTGKYPALALGPDGKLYCLWSYNEGTPTFLEELRPHLPYATRSSYTNCHRFNWANTALW